MNTDVLWPDRELAESQVLRIQIKLHQWAIDDPDRRFDDLFNTFTDPRLAAAVVDRLTFNAHIIQTGTNSYRLTSTRAKKGVANT